MEIPFIFFVLWPTLIKNGGLISLGDLGRQDVK